jgi:polygalacturonase
VTVGSEIAAGVKNVHIKDCLFMNTDRGLRVKTRRGRGQLSVLDDISFENIDMDNVMTPFVVNSFYFCDPDGKTEYVGTRKALPVDHRTPSIKSLTFKDIKATNCHVAGTYIYGLPESKIGKLTFENIRFEYAKDAKSGVAAMMTGCEEASRQGMIVNNVKELVMKNVEVIGCEGEPVVADNVDTFIKE